MATTKKWVIIIPVLAGIAAIALLKQSRPLPVQEPLQEKPRLVRALPAPVLTVTPKVRGHGTVRPGRTWDAVAQVKGKIIEKHPRLQKGAILEQGSTILRIDPTDYELAIAQTEADIQATQAQLEEIAARSINTQASLKIEQAALALNQKELERKRKLVGKGSVSRSDLENQERSLLGQQQSVQTQKNTLNLMPSQKALLRAQLARHQATLASARRSLANTVIQMPFTGRIAEVQVEQDQYVREGEVLISTDDLQTAEVEVQIAIDQMSQLIQSDRVINLLNRPAEASANALGLKADVALRENGLAATWEARVARFSDTLDPKTRTVGVIVEVDAPYANVQPGIRPPLVKGLFVEVRLSGKPRADALVIPRSALRGQTVYVANADNRLEFRPVQVALLQPEYAVIQAGLNPGERVVISDLSPAIDGMLLKPQDDPGALEQLRQTAGTQP